MPEPINPTSPEPSSSGTGAQSGGTITPVYSKRNMKAFTVTEDEMNSISHFNAETAIFSSVCSFFLSALLSLGIQCIFTKVPTQDEKVFSATLGVTFFILIIVSGILAFRAYKSKKNSVETIISESVGNDD